MADLVFFFLRYGRDEPDDVLRITPTGDNQFHLLYQNGEERSRATHITTREGALGYIWTMLYTVAVDTDPFRYVQLCGVGFPSVMYSISELDPGGATWITMIAIVHSFLDRRWSVTPAPVVIPRGRFRRTALGAQNNRSSSVPQSVPVSESQPSQQESGVPPQTEWGGEASRTTEPS